MNNIVNLKRKELLSLPHKETYDIKEYSFIIVVPTNKKHDSGWRLMALIGAEFIDKKYVPTEIIGYCDDINLILPENTNKYKPIRYDMLLSNCIRMWSHHYNFAIGMCLSSTDIYVVEDNKNNKI